MKKVKRAATHAVLTAHKHAPKTRTVLEAVANIFVAVESKLLILSVLLILWTLVDLFDVIEVKGVKHGRKSSV